MTSFGRLGALFDRLPHIVVLLLCLALVAVVGVVDLLTGADFVFSVFYAVPIALATWVLGRTSGLLFSVVATTLWTVGDHNSLDQTWASGVPWWNAAVRLAFFAMVVLILAALKQALGEEQRLARVDALTRVPNVRHFREQAELELRRAQRTGQPLSVAIFDVDDLKVVNDRFGHPAGDALLIAVSRAWRHALRTTDVIARLGGDEFAVLLPDTSYEAALVALKKGRGAALVAIGEGGWPASLSIGAVTYLGGEADVEGLLRHADALMYEVKSGGKDGVHVAVLGDADPVRPAGSRAGRIVSI
ncbi:MAG TPA: GGDEF domain-containing protein [Thermoleophilia bacterium]